MPKNNQVAVTFRFDADEWALFTGILSFKRKRAIDLFRNFVGEYVEQNKSIVNFAELEKSASKE
jgi:hypothetical protein